MLEPLRSEIASIRLPAVAGALLMAFAGLLVPVQGQQRTAPIARLEPPQFDEPSQVVNVPDPEDAAAVMLRSAMPINLPVALRLAVANNLDLVQAREFVRQADINWDRALIGFLPTFNIGSAYSTHEGNIAKTEGNIIKVNKDSLFVGGGPTLTLSLSDALFAPLIMRQLTAAAQAGRQRTTNDTFLAVGDAYFNIMRARRRMARAEEALDYLTSEKPSPGRAGSKGLLPVIKSVQLAGGAEATKSEVERVRVDVARRSEEKAGALQDFRVAMAELARLVRLDPQIPLWPVEDFRFPMTLPGAAWRDQPLEELVRVALNNRPELAENQALIQAAVERVRTAQWRPLLPNLAIGYNFGDFGGSPDLNPSIVVPATKTTPAKVITQAGFGGSGEVRHFAPRADFDASVVWKLQNMGFGDLANVREQQSRLRQAQAAKTQMQDRVIAQVVQANAAVVGWRQRVQVIREALFDATGAPRGPVFESLRLNFDRIRTVPNTRPLEALDSTRRLNDVLETYSVAITEYERAQFSLLIVLGLPPRELLVPPEGECKL